MKAIKWALCTAALLAVGCAPSTPPTTPAPTMTAPAQAPEDALHQRIDTLQQASGDLTAQVNRLPGGNEAEHRTLVAASFADLLRILPLLYGPTSSEQFAQQIRVIDSSRGQVVNAAADLSVEPAIDTGLRAAGRGFTDIAQFDFSGNADIANTVQHLHEQLVELDSVRGPEHRVVVANALTSTLQIAQLMTAVLSQHLPTEAPAATTPASAPVATPAPASTPVPAPTLTPAPATPSEPTTAPTSAPAASLPQFEHSGLLPTVNDQ